MTTFEEFSATFTDVQRDLTRDYPDITAICHMMHKEIGLGETPREGAAELAEAMSTEGETVDPDALDLTTEHAELHAFLRQLQAAGVVAGASEEQMLATMFVVGRRVGMRDAAGLGTDVEQSLSDWLGAMNPPKPSDND
jgi:hypothetical protein